MFYYLQSSCTQDHRTACLFLDVLKSIFEGSLTNQNYCRLHIDITNNYIGILLDITGNIIGYYKKYYRISQKILLAITQNVNNYFVSLPKYITSVVKYFSDEKTAIIYCYVQIAQGNLLGYLGGNTLKTRGLSVDMEGCNKPSVLGTRITRVRASSRMHLVRLEVGQFVVDTL